MKGKGGGGGLGKENKNPNRFHGSTPSLNLSSIKSDSSQSTVSTVTGKAVRSNNDPSSSSTLKPELLRSKFQRNTSKSSQSVLKSKEMNKRAFSGAPCTSTSSSSSNNGGGVGVSGANPSGSDVGVGGANPSGSDVGVGGAAMSSGDECEIIEVRASNCSTAGDYSSDADSELSDQAEEIVAKILDGKNTDR